MTIYNDICRRTHLPREHSIRRIMSGTGVDLSLYGPCSEESIPCQENAEETGCEEGHESELEHEDDPCFSFACGMYTLIVS